mgnify:CR=1 FL=1
MLDVRTFTFERPVLECMFELTSKIGVHERAAKPRGTISERLDSVPSASPFTLPWGTKLMREIRIKRG